MEHKYDDIICLARPVLEGRAPMSNYDRAAQFAPFAALTGFEAAVEEAARLTDARIELGEDAKAMLDAEMARILAEVPRQPRIRVTWFVGDSRKEGGTYETALGNVRRVDAHGGHILLTDGRAIPIREIFCLRMLPEDDTL